MSFSAQKFGQMIVDLCEIVKTWKWHKLLPFHLQGTASSMAFLLTSRFPSCSDLANLIFSLKQTAHANRTMSPRSRLQWMHPLPSSAIFSAAWSFSCASVSLAEIWPFGKTNSSKHCRKAPNISGNAKKKFNHVGVCRIDSTSKETASHSSAKGPSTALWVSAVQVTPSFSFSRLRLRHRKKYISPVSEHWKCHLLHSRKVPLKSKSFPQERLRRGVTQVWRVAKSYRLLASHTFCAFLLLSSTSFCRKTPYSLKPPTCMGKQFISASSWVQESQIFQVSPSIFDLKKMSGPGVVWNGPCHLYHLIWINFKLKFQKLDFSLHT